MSRRLEIENLAAAEVREVIDEAVNAALGPLREELREVNEQLRLGRKVITLKEATSYFNHEVRPDTILRYIHDEGLKATRRGRLYFIRLDDLYEWQTSR